MVDRTVDATAVDTQQRGTHREHRGRKGQLHLRKEVIDVSDVHVWYMLDERP